MEALQSACRLALAEGSGLPRRRSLSSVISRTKTQQGGLQLPVSGQLETLWQRHSRRAPPEVPDFKFHIWLEPLEPAGLTDSTLYVRAPEHIRTSVAERYLPLLRRVASGCADSSLALEVVGDDWDADATRAPRSQAGAPLEHAASTPSTASSSS